MKKALKFFMTSNDEEQLSHRLVTAIPSLRFLDDCIWDVSAPIERRTIVECKSNHVYLWDPTVVPRLPIVRRNDGKWEGPASGPVIQLERCTFRDSPHVMSSGRLAHGLDDQDPNLEALDKFSQTIWRITKKMACKSNLVAVELPSQQIINSRVGGYILGADAVTWCSAAPERLFRDRGTIVYYRPSPVAEAALPRNVDAPSQAGRAARSIRKIA